MKVGSIGSGTMGKPMARNLLKAGHESIVYDMVRSNMDEAVKGGAKAVPSSKDAATQCSLIITTLLNSPHVKSVVLGMDGVLEGVAPGTILVDMGPIVPLVSQEIYRECKKKGVEIIDTPVSGGKPKAIDGTPSIMAGGEKGAFEQVYDMFMTMGASAVHYGDIGAGNTAKLANQVIVVLNIVAVPEAFMLSTRAGVDPLKAFDVIKGGLAGSMAMNAKVPMIIGGNSISGSKIDLHIKDSGNALGTGHGVGTPLPLIAQVMEIIQNLHADGLGEDDHSTVARHYEKLTGTEIRK